MLLLRVISKAVHIPARSRLLSDLLPYSTHLLVLMCSPFFCGWYALEVRGSVTLIFVSYMWSCTASHVVLQGR